MPAQWNLSQTNLYRGKALQCIKYINKIIYSARNLFKQLFSGGKGIERNYKDGAILLNLFPTTCLLAALLYTHVTVICMIRNYPVSAMSTLAISKPHSFWNSHDGES